MRHSLFVGLFLIIFVSIPIFGHSGRTDKNGGHFNRKTDIYHCHSSFCFDNKSIRNHSDQSKKRYLRKGWSPWTDTDNDCQNTRAEVLIMRSLVPVEFKTEKKCRVIKGKWNSPYSNTSYEIAHKVDIDHVVSLKEAHISGGSTWSWSKRKQFVNDPRNLIVVSSSENRRKGAKDPALWLPDNKHFHCEYIKLWIDIKKTYQLSIDDKEQHAISSVLQYCE